MGLSELWYWYPTCDWWCFTCQNLLYGCQPCDSIVRNSRYCRSWIQWNALVKNPAHKIVLVEAMISLLTPLLPVAQMLDVPVLDFDAYLKLQDSEDVAKEAWRNSMPLDIHIFSANEYAHCCRKRLQIVNRMRRSVLTRVTPYKTVRIILTACAAGISDMSIVT